MSCRCGRALVSEIGQGYVVTASLELRWLRRRNDALVCENCGASYDFGALMAMSSPGSREVGRRT